MIFGDFQIAIHNFGNFRLDGGAMFGSVPKNLWAKKIEPDIENRIPLATNSLIIKHEKRHFIVDVGNGTKWSDKLRDIYQIEDNPTSDLVSPRNVTDVILTHLHFDHAGGITEYKNGIVQLTYPEAVIYLQRDNLSNAQNPSLKERASYLKDHVEPLLKAKLSLTNSTQEIYPGIFVHQINGHTSGQQIVELKQDKLTLLFLSDLVPTSHHLPLPYHMGYDICASTAMTEKEKFLSYAIERDAVVVFQHDINIQAAKIEIDQRGHYAIKEVVAI